MVFSLQNFASLQIRNIEHQCFNFVELTLTTGQPVGPASVSSASRGCGSRGRPCRRDRGRQARRGRSAGDLQVSSCGRDTGSRHSGRTVPAPGQQDIDEVCNVADADVEVVVDVGSLFILQFFLEAGHFRAVCLYCYGNTLQ